MTFNPPWAANGGLRPPTPVEQDGGFQCGPADRELFNYLFNAIQIAINDLQQAEDLQRQFGTLQQLRDGLASGDPADLASRLDDIRTFVLEQPDAQRPYVDLTQLRAGGLHDHVAHSDDIFQLIGELIAEINLAAITLATAQSISIRSDQELRIRQLESKFNGGIIV